MRADKREMDSDASDSTNCAWDIPVKPERARQRTPKLSRATTIKKDKGAPSPRCAVVVEPASPSRDAGPPVRTTREVFKRLVATLDSVLPTDFRSVPRPNGAGARSLGNAGRSAHDVLADAVRFVAARRHKLDQQAMLRSRGSMTVEVETSDCTITAMSPGAENFFKDAPWGSMMGQSLRDFVKWEDLDNLNALMSSPVKTPAGHDNAPSSVSGSRPASPASPLSSSCSSASSSSRRGSLKADAHAESRCIRLMHFTSMESDMPSRPRCAPRWAAAYSSDDSEGPGCQPVQSSTPDWHVNEVPFTLPLVAAARGWSDAFEHDPMFCDQTEADDSEGRFLAKYVQTNMQVLPVKVASTTEPHRVLVVISLL
jgi:hypothetical protein